MLEEADVPPLRFPTGRLPVMFVAALTNVVDADPVPPRAIGNVPAVIAEAFSVPLFVNVTPDGMLNVSPEAPRVTVVPVLGSIVFTFIKLIYTTTKVDPEGIVKVPVMVIGPADIALLAADTVISEYVLGFSE